MLLCGGRPRDFGGRSSTSSYDGVLVPSRSAASAVSPLMLDIRWSGCGPAGTQVAIMTVAAAGVLFSNVLRGATLSGDPLTWQFQVLWFLHFLTIPLLLTLMVGLLVVAPTHEAYTSMKVRHRHAQSSHMQLTSAINKCCADTAARRCCQRWPGL